MLEASQPLTHPAASHTVTAWNAVGSPLESSKIPLPRIFHNSLQSTPGTGSTVIVTRMALLKLWTEWHSKAMAVAGKDLAAPFAAAAWLRRCQRKYHTSVCLAQVWCYRAPEGVSRLTDPSDLKGKRAEFNTNSPEAIFCTTSERCLIHHLLRICSQALNASRITAFTILWTQHVKNKTSTHFPLSGSEGAEFQSTS